MAKVIITDPADADTAMIFEDLTRKAGARVAETYNAKFEHLYDQLADHPGSCQARPNLGAHIRVGVVNPYLVIYRYVMGADTVSIIRVLHGSPNIPRRTFQPPPSQP